MSCGENRSYSPRVAYIDVAAQIVKSAVIGERRTDEFIWVVCADEGFDDAETAKN